ncbi:MAG: hypothetical protein JXA60_08580 [Candidatus Coatesbacteria bacterium]|nr:hypothetical protein [Candidatus Coatesbacteria bacterium]
MIPFVQIGLLFSFLLVIFAMLKKVGIIPELLFFGLTSRTLMVGAFYIVLLMISLVLIEIWKKLTNGKGGGNDR